MQERKHNVVKRKKSIVRMAVLAIPLALLLLLSQTAFAQNTYVITEFVADAANPGSYFVYFDQINASQMRETVYLTVCEGDTAVSNTVTYSVESYVAAKLNDSNVKLANLVASIIKYGDAAYNLNH